MLSLLGMRCYFFLFLLVFQTVSSLIPDDSYSEYVPDYGDEVVEQSYGPEFDVESGKPDYPPSCKEFGFPDGKIMDEVSLGVIPDTFLVLNLFFCKGQRNVRLSTEGDEL